MNNYEFDFSLSIRSLHGGCVTLPCTSPHAGNWMKWARVLGEDSESDGDEGGKGNGGAAEDQLTTTSSAWDTGNCWHCLFMFQEFPTAWASRASEAVERTEYLLVTCRLVFLPYTHPLIHPSPLSHKLGCLQWMNGIRWESSPLDTPAGDSLAAAVRPPSILWPLPQ